MDEIAKNNEEIFYSKVLKSKVLKDRFEEITDILIYKIITDQINTEEEYSKMLDYDSKKLILRCFKNLDNKVKREVLKEINNEFIK